MIGVARFLSSVALLACSSVLLGLRGLYELEYQYV